MKGARFMHEAGIHHARWPRPSFVTDVAIIDEGRALQARRALEPWGNAVRFMQEARTPPTGGTHRSVA
jgi:hypothetical protein